MTQSISLSNLLRILWRRKGLLAMAAILGVALALSIVALVPDRYTARGMVMVLPDEIAAEELRGAFSPATLELPLVRSQVDALQADALLHQVVRELNLAEDEDFRVSPPAWRQWLNEHLPRNAMAAEPTTVDSVALIANQIKKDMLVTTDGRSYVVHVGFSDSDPIRGAKIVNTLLQNFVQGQVDVKLGENEQFNDELLARVENLRGRVALAEAAVRDFRRDNALIETLSGTVAAQQVAEINTALTEARAELAQAEARFASAQVASAAGTVGSSAPEVLNSPTIIGLREAESALMQDRADLAARFVDNHPALQAVNRQLADIRGRIASETRAILDSLGRQAEVARAREDALSQQLRNLGGDAATSADASSRLESLTAEAEAQREIYETFLAQVERLARPQTLARPDARVLSWALPPVEPVGPSTGFLAASAGLGAALLAFGGVVARQNFADNGFETMEEVAAITGLPALATIPDLGRRNDPMRYVAHKPHSAVAETIRWSLGGLRRGALPAFAGAGAAETRGSIFLVTSALPDEGKTTYSAAVGRLLAQNENRVLLIELDLRRPSFRDVLGGDQPYQLQDILEKNCDVAEALNVDPASGMHFITGRRDAENPQLVLQSPQFRNFLENAAQHYDYVILDSPPAMNVYDPMILARCADAVAVVIRKGRTPRRAVTETLRRLRGVTDKPVGAVLIGAEHNSWDKGYYNGY